MDIGVIVQARSGSTRLPEKVLLDLSGRTVLERVIERVSCANLVDVVIVATTLNKEDDRIEEICQKAGVMCFRGSEEDVLDRFYQAAKHYEIKQIVRVTADCPLMDSAVIDIVISRHMKEFADYTSNTIEETFPDGEDVEVFSFSALQRAWQEASLKSEREHVTPYLKKNKGLFKLVSVRSDCDLSGQRWTLDEQADYILIKEIYAVLGKKGHIFGIKEIIGFLKDNPQVACVNRRIGRNEGYLRSLQDDKKVV